MIGNDVAPQVLQSPDISAHDQLLVALAQGNITVAEFDRRINNLFLFTVSVLGTLATDSEFNNDTAA